MEHRTTFEQMVQARDSLRRMQAYLIKLRATMAAKTPHDPIIDWADNADWQVEGLTVWRR